MEHKGRGEVDVPYVTKNAQRAEVGGEESSRGGEAGRRKWERREAGGVGAETGIGIRFPTDSTLNKGLPATKLAAEGNR